MSCVVRFIDSYSYSTYHDPYLPQVVKMLIAVVTIFATLWLPHRGMLVYNTVAVLTGSQRYMDLWFLMFAKTCIYINRWHITQ